MLHLQDLLTDAEQMSELLNNGGLWILGAGLVYTVVASVRKKVAKAAPANSAPSPAPQHPTEP